MKTDILLNRLFGTQFPRRLLIRVDAGAVKGLSFGHLSRCLVFAEALTRCHSTQILFVMADYPEGVEFALKKKMNIQVIPSTPEGDIAQDPWFSIAKIFRPDWTLVDLPYVGDWDATCRQIRSLGSKVLFIDDTRFVNPRADIILNSSILAPDRMTHRHLETTYLLGPEYFFMATPSFKHQKTDEFRVLISFGGSDPSGLTVQVVQAIEEIRYPITVSLVLGPGYRAGHPGSFEQLSKDTDFEIIEAPEDVYPFFVNADLIICAGGRTLYELIELGIPALPIASIEHERPVVKKFISDRLVFGGVLYWNKETFLSIFSQSIKQLSRMKDE